MNSEKARTAENISERISDLFEKYEVILYADMFDELFKSVESYAESRVREVKRDAVREIEALKARVDMEAKRSVDRGMQETAKEINKYIGGSQSPLGREHYIAQALKVYAEARVRECIMTYDKSYMTGKIEGFKAGQEAMRERAARRACNGFDAEQIRSLSIEEEASK